MRSCVDMNEIRDPAKPHAVNQVSNCATHWKRQSDSKYWREFAGRPNDENNDGNYGQGAGNCKQLSAVAENPECAARILDEGEIEILRQNLVRRVRNKDAAHLPFADLICGEDEPRN